MFNVSSFTQRGISVFEGKLTAPLVPSNKPTPYPLFSSAPVETADKAKNSGQASVANTQDNINESYAKLLVALNNPSAR